MITKRFYILFIFVVLLAGVSGATAQQEPKITSDYSALIEETLPSWDESVLKAPAQKIWTDRVSMKSVEEAVRDKIPTRSEKETYQDKDRKLKIDKDKGYIRYINSNRDYKHGVSPAKAVDRSEAEKMILGALTTIGLPRDEMRIVIVSTVIGQGGSTREKIHDEKTMREQMVYINRQINNLPVYASEVKGAVSNSDEIARLLIKWPDFLMADVKKLRTRNDVTRDIVQQIENQTKGMPVSVNMNLAYTPLSYEGRIRFVPGIVVTVRPAEGNGFAFTVPVSE